MDNREAVNWLINISADIGKAEHSDLWHYEQALAEIKDMLESAQPVVTDIYVGRKDLINRRQAIDALIERFKRVPTTAIIAKDVIENLPSAQPEYEPVKAEDFAKTMSENTLYGFIAWHSRALELMERQGFVICKKTM